MSKSEEFIIGEKCGTITVDVFKTDNNLKFFYIKSNTKDILNVCDIIEDTLKLY